MKQGLTELWRNGAVRSLLAMALVVGLCASYAFGGSQPQTTRQSPRTGSQPPKKASATVSSYTRPRPTLPSKPQVPGMDRTVSDKFFLEKADILYAVDGDSTGRQIVSGDVVFRKQGMLMYCDSAYYYPVSSSMEAFGNVRMVQGDTVTVTADYANYDGFTEQAQLQSRGAGRVVRLEHVSKGDKTVKTLETDLLDYNLITGEARYDTGGRMFNRSLVNSQTDTLTSNVGTYDTRTYVAEVTDNVFMRNATSRLRTDRLVYHADTRIVDIVDRTSIDSGAEKILTSSGKYEASTGSAMLDSRSIIAHTDSAGNVTTLEGDSIVYNKQSRVSEAFMFRNPSRTSAPMVITDTARNAILIGGYGYYNDSTRLAYAERYPLLKEYSRADTIFLRAERVFLETVNPGVKESDMDLSLPDSIRPKPESHIAKAYNRARFFRSDLQGIADSITFISADSMLFLNRKPIVWSGGRMVSGPVIQVHFNDSTPDWAVLPRKGIVVEAIEEGFYNQLRAGHVHADFTPDGDLDKIQAYTDVQTIFLPQERDSTYNKLVSALGDTLSVDMTGKEMSKLKLWTREASKITGSVTPLMSVTRRQYYLSDFMAMAGAKRFSEMDSVLVRLEKLRPTYNVYRNGWSDDLGELSFELEDYFDDPGTGIVDDTPVAPPSIAGAKMAAVPSVQEVEAEEIDEIEKGEAVPDDTSPETVNETEKTEP